MKLRKLYEAAVAHGKSVDPRGEDQVQKSLEEARKEYEELSESEKERFDTERLSNPYSDSRILYGADDTEIKSVMVGIDMEAPEIVLADRLREKGRRIDLVWAHHPEGPALANLGGVMAMQADILHRFGVPINIAEGMLESRIREVERRVLPTNHMRAVDAAELLDIPMMCTHTPADNCVAGYLQELFDRENPERVGDVLDLLRGIPEYAAAERHGMALKVITGARKRRAGRIYVDMTGGTSGAENTFEQLASRSDIGTMVAMHLPEKHREQAKKHHISVVIAGHMASDSLGMNLLLDGIEKLTSQELEVIGCSGFRRYEHKS
ncbi:MAG: NGG1p interacting factor NIF3 [Candidatus Eisenbacteria bacterium]|nr:NGG1p interacting factor NIF3 [Candidatus Eisenbacteria bacterium]